MTAHEIVIRLGRPRDLQYRSTHTRGSPAFSANVTEITIPFADRESAEAALLEVEVTVREVHDAGGEDYRPVVAGEVIPAEVKALPARRPRLRACVEQWPEAVSGDYNPSCCRFPKSCSATIYDEARVDPADLEGDAR